ncbi:hypothetical protein OAE79_01970 [Rhodopirellula sp.]|nr:hypothetical protein [Rhodopirellula sp.]MDB4679083.1 hypothetical protein [Rhodopirellula sp.]
MARILFHRLPVFAVVLGAWIALAPADASAGERVGLFAKLKANDGGCLFSLNRGSESPSEGEIAEEPAEESQTEEEVAEKVNRRSQQGGGLFARLRSKRAEKDSSVESEDAVEQSSSDLPVEEIPPAPKS